MGIGGAAQGILAAAALLCVGGEMQARLKPRNEHEAGECRAVGLFDLQRKYALDELASGSVMCAATGITPGDYLQGVRYVKGGAVTNSVVMRSCHVDGALHRGTPPLRPAFRSTDVSVWPLDRGHVERRAAPVTRHICLRLFEAHEVASANRRPTGFDRTKLVGV